MILSIHLPRQYTIFTQQQYLDYWTTNHGASSFTVCQCLCCVQHFVSLCIFDCSHLLGFTRGAKRPCKAIAQTSQKTSKLSSIQQLLEGPYSWSSHATIRLLDSTQSRTLLCRTLRCTFGPLLPYRLVSWRLDSIKCSPPVRAMARAGASLLVSLTLRLDVSGLSSTSPDLPWST
jgi:hypothetical protein